MKRIICLCVILLCSISFAVAQGAKPGRTNTNGKKVVKKTVVSPFAEAEKAWIPFWRDFKQAVKNRDKDSLKEMISKNYTCYENSSGECSCSNFADKRNIFFCEFEDIWKRLSELLTSKISFGKTQIIEGEISKSANRKYGDFTEYYVFKFELNSKWQLIKHGVDGL